MVAKRELGVGGHTDWGFEVSHCKPLHIEQINNKVLLYSTGGYIQNPGINHNEKEYKKQCIDVYN